MTAWRRRLAPLALMAALMAARAAPAPPTAPAPWEALTLPMLQAVGAPQGLGNVVVTAIAQDRDGFLWVGTAGGLSRWDGYRFRNYTHAPGDPRSLPDNMVTALHADGQGRLWVGTGAGGLARYAPAGDDFVNYPSPAGPADGDVTAMADAPGGDLWLATASGLVHLRGAGDPRRASAVRVRPDGAAPIDAASDFIGALAPGPDGTLWVGTGHGLMRRERDGRFTDVPLPPARGYAGGTPVHALWFDHAGLLWIGTGGDGVYVLDPRGGPMRRFAAGAAAADLMKRIAVSAIAEPVPGEIWVSSLYDGVAVIDSASGRVRPLAYTPHAPGGLSNSVVYTLFGDRAGALWIGTGNGLNQRPPGQAAGSLAPRQGERPGLSGDEPAMMTQAPDGTLWFAQLRQGADVVGAARARVDHWRQMRAPLNGIVPSAAITGLGAVERGKMWLATPSGLFRAGLDGGASAPVSAPWLDKRVVVRVLAAVDGSVWLGTTSEGLIQARLDGAGVLRRMRRIEGLSGAETTVLLAGPAGSLWAGSSSGLDRVDTASGAVLEKIGADRADPASLSHPYVGSLLTDRRGRLWVGVGSGVDILERGADGRRRFRRVDPAQGWATPGVGQLLEDRQGRVWASTDAGIAVIDPDSLAVDMLGPAGGALYAPYWAGSGVAAAGGELLFGGTGGVTIVHPERYRPWRLAPPLVVTEVRVGGKPVPPGRFHGDGGAALEVPADANSFAVGFAALDFTAPELNQYAYRLDGFDRDWARADAAQRLASYTNLPPGDYRLLIRGTNRAGVWSARELALPVRVLPWWWQTWWFRAAAALAGLAALYGAHRLRIWRLAAQRGALEREVAARTAEVLRQKALADQQRGEAERQHRQASERNAELAAVNAVAHTLAGKLELDQMIALVGDQVRRLFQAERACITLLDEDSGAPLVAYTHGQVHGHDRADALAAADEAALGRVLASGRGELADDGAVSGLYVPIIANGVVRGAAAVRRAAGPYQASDQRLLDTIAAHLGAALQNARLFQQAEAARARAEEATQAKSMFLANMSHEIRTPMNAVIGLSYLALGTGSPSRQRDYLQKIHNAGNSLVGIISDILDFSKIEAGKLDIENADFDLDDLLAHVAAIAGGAGGGALECNFDVPADVPRRLRGDAQRLGQVLINLLNNALKFTARGEVALAVRAPEEQDGRVRLAFSVRDSGIGMSAPQLDQLFQAFTQVDGSSTRRFGGTGLGLSICKNLVDLMGGTIAVDSAPGVGSRFVVELWLGRASDALAPAPGLPAALAALRVLVVDDNATARAALEGTLGGLGIAAVAVDGPLAAAHALAGAARYDLLLVDAGLAGAGGWGEDAAPLASVLAARDGAAPKLALLTGAAGDGADGTGDADACLVKPVTRAAMADKLLRLFAPGQRHGAPGQRRPPPRFDGARVLLVEDNEINQEIAVGLLEACGVAVDLANNGREALERLRAVDAARHYQLVFMDLHMPELDGHAATVRLRRDSRFDALPIIAMTANAMPAERQRCRDEGFDDHLSKPLIPAELYRMLGEHLDTAARGAWCARRRRAPLLEDGVPGLDLALARQGVDGDEALLRKVLRMFARDERDRAGRIRAALGRGDHAGAERHAHSLRGLAEGIGALALARLAGDLERAARRAREARAGGAAPAPDAPAASHTEPAALAALDTELAALCAELDALPPAEAGAAAGTARAPLEWLRELRRLDQLMRARDGAAVGLFAAGAADFAASFGAWDAEAIQRGLDDLDFDGAHAALRWVAHKHELSL
ncbi:ATP-binding protein [Oxalobacteraceae bacterium OTU3REALA1]|nr:ATP-binding protein [Oxalobacteraceae bacterium OTU3REALA1]